ncbi:MAG: Holliday junction branch migration protein RuvA [Magnetococcales bacterium]|nr:Holliday junction branch migration protein RuvA [Magnetococcales bacterium]
MIARLRGVLAEKQPNQVLIDVGGVGYRVFIPLSTYTELPPVDEATELWTITYVREEFIHLYGFASQEERALFNLLTGVSGVGGRLALAVLSTLSPGTILEALAHEDVATLSRVPGIGRKTAQRLAMELKDKTGGVVFSLPALNRAGSAAGFTPPPGLLKAELTSALINLGFKAPQVEQALRRVLTSDIVRLEDGLRLALKDLSS